jgi:hypothetical protein
MNDGTPRHLLQSELQDLLLYGMKTISGSLGFRQNDGRFRYVFFFNNMVRKIEKMVNIYTLNTLNNYG